MNVKQLITYLYQFDPNCEVAVNTEWEPFMFEEKDIELGSILAYEGSSNTPCVWINCLPEHPYKHNHVFLEEEVDNGCQCHDCYNRS